MTSKDITSRYNVIAQNLHWAMAIIILGLLLSGFSMGYLADVTRRAAIGWHKSFGVLVLVLGLVRLLWRFVSPPPPLPAQQPLIEKFLAHSIHLILYILFLVQPAIGVLHSWAKGYPVVVFNVAPLPPLVAPDKGLAEAMHLAHFFIGWGLLGVVCIHVVAVLKHHFIDGDGVLLRMLPATKKDP